MLSEKLGSVKVTDIWWTGNWFAGVRHQDFVKGKTSDRLAMRKISTMGASNLDSVKEVDGETSDLRVCEIC